MNTNRQTILNSMAITMVAVNLMLVTMWLSRELVSTKARLKALENDMISRFAYEGDFVRYSFDTDNFLESKAWQEAGAKPVRSLPALHRHP